MVTTFALFSATELSDLVHEDVTEPEALIAERVAWGWLSDVLGLDSRPEDPTEQLKTWGLELGGIAFDNPTGRDEHQLGQSRSKFSAERRREILDAARASVTGQTAGAPLGSFPEPSAWPDPIGW